MAKNLTPAHLRDRGLNDLAATIEHLWGPRCSRNEGGCGCCTAWAIFDCMEKLTDSSSLDCAPKAQGAPRTGEESKSGADVAEEAKG